MANRCGGDGILPPGSVSLARSSCLNGVNVYPYYYTLYMYHNASNRYLLMLDSLRTRCIDLSIPLRVLLALTGDSIPGAGGRGVTVG